MFYIFVCSVLGLSACGFFYLDGPLIIKNSVVPYINKAKSLKTLVSTQYTGKFNILWVSLTIIFKALYIMLIQYLNNTVIKIDKNKFQITYVIDGKLYKLVVKTKRGPRSVLIVYNENQQDMTDIILPFLGPQEDLHRQDYTPDFFNSCSLTFELSNGSELTFKTGETINFLK